MYLFKTADIAGRAARQRRLQCASEATAGRSKALSNLAAAYEDKIEIPFAIDISRGWRLYRRVRKQLLLAYQRTVC